MCVCVCVCGFRIATMHKFNLVRIFGTPWSASARSSADSPTHSEELLSKRCFPCSPLSSQQRICIAISCGVVMIVSCNQAATLVPEVLALSMPLTLSFCQIPRLRMPLRLHFPKILSTSSFVKGPDTKVSLQLFFCSVPYRCGIVVSFIV